MSEIDFKNIKEEKEKISKMEAEEKRIREVKCGEALREILKTHNCKLDMAVEITEARGNQFILRLTAL